MGLVQSILSSIFPGLSLFWKRKMFLVNGHLHSAVTNRDALNYKSEGTLTEHILLEGTDLCLWAIDKNFKLLACNKVYTSHMYALSNQFPLIGGTDLILSLPADFSEKIIEGYKAALNGQTVKILDKGFDTGGGRLNIAMVFTPVYDSNKSEVIAVSCSRRDISEFIQLQSLLDENEKKFESLAWCHSHLVRGPLTAAMGLINVMRYEQYEYDMMLGLLNSTYEKLEETDLIIRDVVKSSRNVCSSNYCLSGGCNLKI